MARWDPKGKLAVVTGASSGIGRCLCVRLVAADCRVIAVARRGDRLAELQTQIETESSAAKGKLIPITGDITALETRDAIAREVHSRGAALHLLVNNAGIGGIGPFANAPPERLRQIMEVNFMAPAELTRRLLPYLKASGDAVICNIGSVLGHRAVPDKSEYCASKFAMHGWSDALRAELAGSGVAVTLISPSTTRSEFFDSLVGTEEDATSTSVGSWSPDRVAASTLKAIQKRRAEVVLSVAGKLLVYADRLCPPLMNWILRRRPRQ